jgi:hypothetical protein
MLTVDLILRNSFYSRKINYLSRLMWINPQRYPPKLWIRLVIEFWGQYFFEKSARKKQKIKNKRPKKIKQPHFPYTSQQYLTIADAVQARKYRTSA